ncbi:DUF6221 family protein [Micromonospora aurantiaca (nom. illeg.)]|uniref:DUF6221 family protein n=1 Tax=Micromonospora aurantiaca (nom. illeg.) TaxID=47850 RepID=UPI00340C53DC
MSDNQTVDDDLVAWLRAQLDADEAEANDWPDVLGDPPAVGGFWRDTHGHPIYEPRTRRLADVAAKRRIIDDCERYIVADDTAVTDGMVWRTLTALALPYAGRPGYRDEWRP